nr:MAG TPA: hypothetical protein [Caudoviricetes sp.]
MVELDLNCACIYRQNGAIYALFLCPNGSIYRYGRDLRHTGLKTTCVRRKVLSGV